MVRQLWGNASQTFGGSHVTKIGIGSYCWPCSSADSYILQTWLSARRQLIISKLIRPLARKITHESDPRDTMTAEVTVEK